MILNQDFILKLFNYYFNLLFNLEYYLFIINSIYLFLYHSETLAKHKKHKYHSNYLK